jgi:hypothetical protein
MINIPEVKRYILFLLTISFTLSSGAQIMPQVIASAGGYNVSGDMSVSWTVGETITTTFKSGDLILTQGFHQQLILATVEENIDVTVSIKVFPNPAGEVLKIQFETPVDGEIVLSVFDSQGKLFIRDVVESSMVEKQIDLQDIPAGTYFLRLIQGKFINVYKVVKL